MAGTRQSGATMNEPSPYQPPLPQTPSDIPYPLVGEPAVVKVFGILHLVFAALGIISAIWGLFIVFAGNPFLKMAPSSPEIQAQLDMQAKLNPMTIATNTLSLFVAALMIIAGIQLVKNRKTALKWSNWYAFASLGAKAISLVLVILFVVPAMREIARTMIPGSASGGEGAMGMMMAGGAIGSVAVTCIYPILTLILLNRPKVKAWFAHLPG